jgi:hypothetical protein
MMKIDLVWSLHLRNIVSIRFNVVRSERNEEETADYIQVVCIDCGVTIRRDASDDSYGLCLRCFYESLARRLRSQKRAAAGEFVSDR